LAHRTAVYGTVLDVEGVRIDQALALAMDAPQSATGEDVVELHVHGSPAVAGETLRALVTAGARLAEPGEFTRRAFLNGKLDLSAAEAVAALVAAESQAAARAAAANLAGGLRRAIAEIDAVLRGVLEELAGALDFPDEVPAPAPAVLRLRIAEATAALDALVGDWDRGRRVREGCSLAIVGPPNAGKSSLLNALLGEERAIVSPFAGTTRDTLEEAFTIGGVAVRAIDTAGLRQTDDAIERLGIARARRAAEGATVRLVVIDGARPLDAAAHAVLRASRDSARVVFFNKADLGNAGFREREAAEADAVHGSVHDGATLAAIRAAIAAAGWGAAAPPDAARPHLASARQADAVARARAALAEAEATLGAGEPVDLIASDLTAAVAALAELTGAAASEAVLDGVFARFCIGK
jgi:tRNA modification GTPase